MNNYESNHRLKENFELVEMAFFRKKKYEKTAIESAKKIIKERNLSSQEIDELKALIRKRIRQDRRLELKMKREEKGYWVWFIDILIGGI